MCALAFMSCLCNSITLFFNDSASDSEEDNSYLNRSLFRFRKSGRDEEEFPVRNQERLASSLRLCLRRHQRRQALQRGHREGRRIQEKPN